MHCDLLDNLEYQLTRSSSGDWISLSIPVCQHGCSGRSTTPTSILLPRSLIRTTSYSLASILHDHRAVVTPSIYFGRPQPLYKTSFIENIGAIITEADDGVSKTTNGISSTVSPSCDSQITPSCLNALYNISYTPVSTKNNTLHVVGYLDELTNHADPQVRTSWL